MERGFLPAPAGSGTAGVAERERDPSARLGTGYA